MPVQHPAPFALPIPIRAAQLLDRSGANPSGCSGHLYLPARPLLSDGTDALIKIIRDVDVASTVQCYSVGKI